MGRKRLKMFSARKLGLPPSKCDSPFGSRCVTLRSVEWKAGSLAAPRCDSGFEATHKAVDSVSRSFAIFRNVAGENAQKGRRSLLI